MSENQNVPYDCEIKKVLANLDYFTEWGGSGWENLCRHTVHHIGNLKGKTVLEIGPRFGKMSILFAILGARVVGVETNSESIVVAEREAKKWKVQDRVSFFHYNGDLDNVALGEMNFDIIFTKSVLVLLGSKFLDYLKKLNQRLKPGGECIFLENRYGGPIFSLLRMLRPSSRAFYKRVDYLTPNHLQLIRQVFPHVEVQKTYFPPVYLIIAKKTIS